MEYMSINQADSFPWLKKLRNWLRNLKEEEETSHWSGIPIEKLLNESFTEQLNYIQALQQITPLNSAREHLP